MAFYHKEMTMTATKKQDWVRQGDDCAVRQTGAKGEVLRVVQTGSVPYAVVKFDNGPVGRVTITGLVRISKS